MVSKNPAAAVGFSYFAGLLIASCFGYSVNFVAAGVIAAFSLGMLFMKRRLFLAAALAVSAGFLVYGINDCFVYSKLAEADGCTMTLSGRLLSVSEAGNDMAHYVMTSDVNGVSTGVSFFYSDSDVEVGDTVVLDGTFRTFTDTAAFAERSYNNTKGIFLEAVRVNSVVFEENSSFSLTNLIGELNSFTADRIMAELPNDYGGLICAIFLGDKSHISEELKSDVLRSGVSHLTAVSGMHLSIIASVFMAVLDLVRSRHKRKIRFITLLLITLFFMVFFNLSKSVLRAGIMLIIFYGGDFFFRKRSSFNSIGFALLVILLVQPTACRDAGLLLSVAGCFGVGVAAPAINAKFPYHRFKSLREMLVTIVCANFFTVPIAGIFFGGFSTVALATNVLLAFPVVILLVSALMFALTGCTANLFLLAGGLSSKLIAAVIGFFGGLKYAYVSLDYGFLLPWTVVTAIFISVIHLRRENLRTTLKAATLSVCALTGMITVFGVTAANDTYVRVYSDGSSAAVIVRQKDAAAVVATNDSKGVLNFIGEYLGDSFIGDAGVICMLGSSNNALPLFRELPCEYLITPDTDKAFDINDTISVAKTGSTATISVNGVEISVSPVSATTVSDIRILYGNGDTDSTAAGRTIYTNRKNPALNPNESNAYYEKILFYIKDKYGSN